jgi:16S rRNA (cytidine1402-2'-O)-methyltransferase
VPIGNLDDISHRAIMALFNADIVLCEDTRNSKKLFRLLSEKNNISLNNKKFIPIHAHNEYTFLEKVEISFFNQNIVYISDAGSPCISDPGALLVDFCINNSIKYDFIGGSNAFVNAFAMSGFPQSKFLFFGFLINKGKKRLEEIENLLNSPYPSIIYESPHRIIDLINHISKKEPSREVFAVKELTKLNQISFKNEAQKVLEELENTNIKGEWVVIISASKTYINQKYINTKDVLKLDISNKEKSKLISKITGEKTKDVYKLFIQDT